MKQLGINLTNVDTTATHPLGSETEEKGIRYRYVKAEAAIAVGDALKPGATSDALLPTAAVAEVVAGVSPVAIPLNNFGWVAVAGNVSVKAAAGTAAGAKLGSTAVAGTLGALVASAAYAQAEATAAIAAAAGVPASAVTAVAGGTVTARLA